jgi:hypothetical protein
MPIEVVVPRCLDEEHQRLTMRYEKLKGPEYGPGFNELTAAQAAVIGKLYKQVFGVARSMIR